MAVIAKVGTPSVSSVPLDSNDKLSNRLAGEGIAPCDACQVHTDGLIYKATGTRTDGFAFTGAQAGEPVTLAVAKTRFRYGKQGTAAPDIVPGTLYYLDAGVAGGLNTTANGNPVALGLDNGVLQVQASY